MSKTVDERLQKLEDQVNALQQLLLSHIVAFDSVDKFATDGTFEIAASQRDAAIKEERFGQANRITWLIEAIQECRVD